MLAQILFSAIRRISERGAVSQSNWNGIWLRAGRTFCADANLREDDRPSVKVLFSLARPANSVLRFHPSRGYVRDR